MGKMDNSMNKKDDSKQRFLEMLVDPNSVDLLRNQFYSNGEKTEFFLGGCGGDPPPFIFSAEGRIGYVSYCGRLYIDDKPAGYRIDFMGRIHLETNCSE